jgi:hypothetical protein
MSSGSPAANHVVTIGTFSTSRLTAQPFGYEGDARTGRTATIVEFSGLLKPSEWLAFKNVYDAWRDTRIQDPDTVVSKAVGTTIAVSVSANGITWASKPCWFTEAPDAEQVGAYVRVSATLVDAAQALAVFLKEETDVDCARIQADLEKQKAETDCEITARQGGLADQFAAQDVTLELINRNAEFDAKASGNKIRDLVELDYKFEVQEKEAQKNKLPTYALDIAKLDIDLDLIQQNAQFDALDANQRARDRAELEYKLEVQQKTAQKAKIDDYATTIAGLDQDLEVSLSNAQAAAISRTKRATIAGNEYDQEIIQARAEMDALDALGSSGNSRLTTLKNVRQLRALYDKELTEDLPSFGNQTLGGATIRLIEPPEGRIETPSFALTATGNALISGALKPVKTKEIAGIITSGDRSAVLDWYDSRVAVRPAPDSLFPAGPPTFEVESVLVSGAKGSRTIVRISVIEIPA